MKVNANALRQGNVLDRNGKLWIVLKAEIMAPGKGAAVVQTEIRDIKTGAKDNVRYRTQETVERVRLEQDDYQYLYADGDSYEFMNVETFEQITIAGDVIGYSKVFLDEGMNVVVESYEDEALGVKLPDKVTVLIAEAEPVVKGQTASSSYKPSILENGERVMVPPHVAVNTRIVVNTEDATYVEKAKD